MAKGGKTKLGEWQRRAQEGGMCPRCNREVSLLTVDHIIPIYFLDSFDDTGLVKYEDEENFQLICKPCNQLKFGRFDKSNSKTKELLLKYINLCFNNPQR